MKTNLFFFIVFHLALGYMAYALPVSGKIYATILTVLTFFLIFYLKKIEHLVYWAAYIMAAEVFTRMTNGLFFYESHKYLAALVFLAVLFRRGIKKEALPYFLYILFLLPAVFLTLLKEADDPSYVINSIRKTILFYIAGPTTLGIGAMALIKFPFKIDWYYRLMQFILYPILSISVFVTVKTPDLREIIFRSSAMFATSGGFGPNQVATALGLGVFAAFVLFLLEKNTAIKWLWLFFTAFIAYRSFLTFSRGGTITGIAMVLAFIFVSARSDFSFFKSRNLKALFLSLVIIGASFYWVMQVTQGMIFNRFAGLTVRGEKKSDITSGRLTIFMIETRDFIRHPILGTGVGRSAKERFERFGVKMASHTEISRLMAEHGIFGILALMILLFVPWIQGIAVKNNLFFYPFFVFWILTIMHSAMRLAAPAVMYAFSLMLMKYEEHHS